MSRGASAAIAIQLFRGPDRKSTGRPQEAADILPVRAGSAWTIVRAESRRRFEAKWTSELIPEGILVCHEPWEVRAADKFRETARLMQEKVPALVQPALWWAPENIYGVPDVIALRSLIVQRFEQLEENLPPSDDRDDYYVALDIKFTTKLDSNSKILDR